MAKTPLDMQKTWRLLGRPTGLRKVVLDLPEKTTPMIEALRGLMGAFFAGIGRGIGIVWDAFWFRVVEILLTTAAIIGICFVVTAARSDGRVDYCFIDIKVVTTEVGFPPMYALEGHRPWRFNSHIGMFHTFDEALEHARKIDCTPR